MDISRTDHDKVFEGFLKRQREEATELARASDLIDVYPISGTLPSQYRVTFHCKGLVAQGPDGPVEADRFEVGVWFPADYLLRADPFQVLTWLGPPNVFHPNISDVAPLICIGRLTRGTSLVDIIYRCFDVITYNNVTMVERDALNRPACAWARLNRQRFPIDRRPLKRRAIRFSVEPAQAERVDSQ